MGGTIVGPAEESTSEFPKPGQSSRGTCSGWSVEARYMYPTPKMIGGIIFHKDWTRIPVRKSRPGEGIPDSALQGPELVALGLMSYTVAQAIRWQFHALAESEEPLGGLCVETRLVQHEVKYSFSESAVSEHELIGSQKNSGRAPPSEEKT